MSNALTAKPTLTERQVRFDQDKKDLICKIQTFLQGCTLDFEAACQQIMALVVMATNEWRSKVGAYWFEDDTRELVNHVQYIINEHRDILRLLKPHDSFISCSAENSSINEVGSEVLAAISLLSVIG